MIDDMALLKQAMERMDAEDPTVAQAAKDRAAQILSDARLSFAKMAELIEQRRLLLRPAIVARIKRMDQPGMLGDAAFRDTGSALRKEGQSFLQIAEAIEGTGRLAAGDRDQTSEPLHPIASEPFYQMASEPDSPAWLTALALVVGIVLFPLRHPLRFLAIALLAIVLFYGFRAVATVGQQVSGYFDAVRHRADTAMSSVSSFVNEQISRPSKDATAPPTTSAAIPSPPVAAPSPPSAVPGTAAAPPATAPAPSASETASPAAPVAAPSPPSATPAGPPASTSRRDARGAGPSKSAANCGATREDPWSRRCAPFEDESRPRAFKDMLPEAIRRNSRMAGPCIGGVGGCYWGGGQH
jgi:hypothetical protein